MRFLAFVGSISCGFLFLEELNRQMYRNNYYGNAVDFALWAVPRNEQLQILALGCGFLLLVTLFLPRRRRTKVIYKEIHKEVPSATPAQIAPAPPRSKLILAIEVLAALSAIIGAGVGVLQLMK